MRRSVALLTVMVMGLVILGWAATAGATVDVTMEVEPPDITLAVSPSQLNYWLVSLDEPEEFFDQLTVTNAGNIPFPRIDTAIDLNAGSGVPWPYSPTTATPKPGEFTLNYKATTDSQWIAFPERSESWSTITTNALEPGDSINLDLRLAAGPNLTPGTGNFQLVFRIVF